MNTTKYLYIGKNRLNESLWGMNPNKYKNSFREDIVVTDLGFWGSIQASIMGFIKSLTGNNIGVNAGGISTVGSALSNAGAGNAIGGVVSGAGVSAGTAIGGSLNLLEKLQVTLEPAKKFITTEFGVVKADTIKAGGSVIGWIQTQLGFLKNGLGAVFGTLVQAIGNAARGAYTFIKGLFNAGGEGGQGIFAYLKETTFLGFPATTWIVWGVIAAFCIIVFTKLVKWLRNRKKNESVSPFINELESINNFFETTNLTEAGVSQKVLQSAAKNAEELNKATDGAENGSTFWKVIKKIAIFLLMALGVYACVMATGGWDGKGINQFNPIHKMQQAVGGDGISIAADGLR